MSHATYPRSLPVSCLTDSLRILREKRAVEERAQLGHCLWNVQGWLQGITLGQPPNETLRSFAAVGDEPGYIEQLETELLKYANATPAVFGADVDDVQMDPASVLLIIQSVLALIAWFRR